MTAVRAPAHGTARWERSGDAARSLDYHWRRQWRRTQRQPDAMSLGTRAGRPGCHSQFATISSGLDAKPQRDRDNLCGLSCHAAAHREHARVRRDRSASFTAASRLHEEGTSAPVKGFGRRPFKMRLSNARSATFLDSRGNRPGDRAGRLLHLRHNHVDGRDTPGSSPGLSPGPGGP